MNKLQEFNSQQLTNHYNKVIEQLGTVEDREQQRESEVDLKLYAKLRKKKYQNIINSLTKVHWGENKGGNGGKKKQGGGGRKYTDVSFKLQPLLSRNSQDHNFNLKHSRSKRCNTQSNVTDKKDIAIFTFYPKINNVIYIDNQTSQPKQPEPQLKQKLKDNVFKQPKALTINKAPLIDYSNSIKLPKAFKTKTDLNSIYPLSKLSKVKQVIKVEMNDSTDNLQANKRIHSLKHLQNKFRRGIISYMDCKANSMNLKSNLESNKRVLKGLKGYGFNS